LNSYTFHINLYDLAFLGAIFIGLTFAGLLWFAKTVNRGANRFLALALVTMILWMVRVLAIDLELETYLPGWHRVPTQFLLALGPLMYFYVLKITTPKFRFRWKDLLHFSPLLLEQAAQVLAVKGAGTDASAYATHTFQQVNPVLQLLIFISIIIYLWLCDKRIQSFYHSLQPILMDRPLIEFRWLRRLLGATALLWLLWLVCVVVNYIGYRNQLGIQVYYPFYIFFVVIIIWTAAAAFLKPQAAVMVQANVPARQPIPAELRAKGTLVKRAMETSLYYQEPELSLSYLAEKLKMPTHELSKVINTVFKKGFNDFINDYRVRDVVAKMQDPAYDNITLLGIAYEAGFNSQSSFTRIFKQLTGKSPTEYKNDLKNLYPTYKLGSQPRIAPVISTYQATPKRPGVKLNRSFMLRNYLKIAWRNLTRNKTISFINIFGLAAGTLCCLYIVLYVQDQYSYDKHYKDAANIYRINTFWSGAGNNYDWATVTAPVAPAMQKDFAEVIEYTRIVPVIGVDHHLVRYKDKSLYGKDAVYADSTLFDMFDFNFEYGNPKTALSAPYSVVLLKSMSDRLFGKEDPMGKVIEIDNQYGKNNFTVQGVVDESLGKSHIHADMYMAMNSGGIGEFILHNNSWSGTNIVMSYIRLRPGTNAAALEKKLPAFINKYGAAELKSFGMAKVLHLQQVGSIHTTPGFRGLEMTKPVAPAFLNILLLIATLIQVIACINFMNLSTARASKRAKEVGVRKVIGAERRDILWQFLGESFLLSIIGVGIALPLLIILLPSLNHITSADISLSFLASYRLWLLLAGLVFITGIVAGSYPAFYLSAFKAIKVIKGNFTSHISVAAIRKSLVVFQFTLSIALITGIVIIYSQLSYIKNKDLGFDKSQKLIFSFRTGEAADKIPAFLNDVRRLAEVKQASRSGVAPGQQVLWDMRLFKAGGNIATAPDGAFFSADENFIKTAGIKILGGRDFRVFDSGKIILNQSLTKALGLTPQTAPGTTLHTQNGNGEPMQFEVAGVMNDYNYSSLHEEVKPMFIAYAPDGGNVVMVSTNTPDYKALISKIQVIWNKDVSGVPFEYSFVDDEVQKQYQTEIVFGRIINSFTLMAILISCLGLFGLAAFSAEQRSKEIGIRKVLGASTQVIVQLLSKDFLKLVVLAFIIAAPVAWWAMNQWLQGFAYKVPLAWWMFAGAGLVTAFIALFTVSVQAIKAAVANPVKSLKTE